MLNIKIDSRKVCPGDTFVAIKGLTVDGHDYIEQAINNGASRIVASHGEYSVETVIASDVEAYITDYLVNNYSEDINKMNLIGVTGTNGKTTTCYLTYQMLNNLGVKTAYIGTIGFYINGEMRELSNTTPHIVELYSLLMECLDAGIETVVMEVSSHALDLGRVNGLKFKVGGFTNLTQDHLDYHTTMEAYLEAKKRLVSMSDKMVVNIDDEYSKCFVNRNTVKIGFNDGDLKVFGYRNSHDGTEIDLKYEGVEYLVKNQLRGKFNVYNYVLMLGICLEFKELSELINAGREIGAPRGRCQIIPVKGGEAVVDYAHTPDAVQKIINAFNEVKEGKLITVVGCGGDRDPVKRPIMGRIASENSDFVVFTSDNPRTEDPRLIMDGIISGVEGDNFVVELDRKEAIKKALDMIEDKTTVLILGKGHEDYQIIGKEKVHLDDVEQVELYNKEINN